MRTVPIHRSLNRANTFLGGDREVVMCAGLISFVAIFFGQSLISTITGIIFWLSVLGVARQLAKADPLMRKVFVADLKFRQRYFPATSHILRKGGCRQNFRAGFKSSGYGYK